MSGILADAWTIHDIDSTIFDSMHIPAGMDRGIIAETIMRETRGLNVIENEPRRLRRLIESWSKQRLFVWTKLFETTKFKYNPIENYDRIEEHVDRTDHKDSHEETGSYDKNGTNTGNTTDKTTRSGENSESADDTTTRTPNLTSNTTGSSTTESSGSSSTNSTEHADTTSTHNVWGFNESAMAPSYQDISESDTTGTTSGSDSRNGSDSSKIETHETGTEKTVYGHTGNGNFSENGSLNRDETGSFNETNDDKRQYENNSIDFSAGKTYVHGNIGIRSSQELIEQERNVALFDLYRFIADDFKGEFCIMVY